MPLARSAPDEQSVLGEPGAAQQPLTRWLACSSTWPSSRSRAARSRRRSLQWPPSICCSNQSRSSASRSSSCSVLRDAPAAGSSALGLGASAAGEPAGSPAPPKNCSVLMSVLVPSPSRSGTPLAEDGAMQAIASPGSLITIAGAVLTVVGSIAYVTDSPTLSLAGVFYGVPVLLGGLP